MVNQVATFIDCSSKPAYLSIIPTCLLLVFLLTAFSALASPPDAYEPDNSYNTAQFVADPSDVLSQEHTFHEFFDQDWLRFHGEKGVFYAMQAVYPSSQCDPVIEIYFSDGTSTLVRIDASGPGVSESYTWFCPEDGTYFIRFTNNTLHFGSGTNYQLAFGAIVFGPTFPGYVQGKVTSGGTGVGGARIEGEGGTGISHADGTYVIGLPEGTANIQVSKDGYQSNSFTVTVIADQTVKKDVSLQKITAPNLPPAISGTPETTAIVSLLYTFIPSASDPNGDNYSFSVMGKPDWAGFNTDNGILAGIPEATDIGNDGPITITVIDSRGAKASLPPFIIETRGLSPAAGILLLDNEE